MWLGNYVVLSGFEVSTFGLNIDDQINFTLKNPAPEQHQHENGMVVSGSLNITIGGEYSKTINAGENAKFSPRAGMTPFPVGTVVNMTPMTDSCRYSCVKNSAGGILQYETVLLEDALPLITGSLYIPINDYKINGEDRNAGTPFVAAEGDTLEAEAGTKIGVFTPT